MWIAAKHCDMELARESILVWPVHEWWTNSHRHGPGQPQHAPDNADFWNDYDYIRWKYATVLATTGGAFDSVNDQYELLRTLCGVQLPPPFPPPPCVYACTSVFDNVAFGTSAFTSSENQAASIIGA